MAAQQKMWFFVSKYMLQSGLKSKLLTNILSITGHVYIHILGRLFKSVKSIGPNVSEKFFQGLEARKTLITLSSKIQNTQNYIYRNLGNTVFFGKNKFSENILKYIP